MWKVSAIKKETDFFSFPFILQVMRGGMESNKNRKMRILTRKLVK